MARTRKEIIQGAIDRGYDKDVINKGLQMRGDKPLSDYETFLIDRGRYGMNFGQRVAQTGIEFGQGLSSLGGAGYRYATQKNFRDYVNKKGKDYLKGIFTGESNPVYDTLNLMIEPTTGMSLGDVLTQNPVKTIKRVGSYIAGDPLNAALDAIPIYGAVTKARPALKASNLLEKATKNVPVVDDIRTAIMPSDRERALNNILNIGNPELTANVNRTRKELEDISLQPNIQQAVQDLTYGTNLGGETTQRLRNFGKDINRQMVDLGVDVGQAKRSATSQFILETLDPRREKNIFIQNIEKAMDNPTMENLANIGVKDTASFNRLVEQGGKLFDEGKIFPVTQRGAFVKGNKEFVDLSDIGKGLTTERVYGRATPEQVAKTLDVGYNKLLSEIQNAKLAQSNLNEIVQKYGRGITPDEIEKIARNEVVISPTEFKEGVKTLFNTGKQSELGTLVKQMSKGTASFKKYANDLYVLNKRDLKALTNKYAGLETGSTLGRMVNASKPIMGAFKSSVLAKLPYVAGNRIGNFSLGLIGGADYLTALKPNVIRDYIPDYLKYTTSFHGIAPQFESSSIANTFKNINRNIARDIDAIRNSNLSGWEKAEAFGRVINEGQAYLTRPLFQAESTMELIDRSAVYINQAKNLARETGDTVEEVLKKAKTNTELQRELINRTNEVLGDYVGRNYYINPTAYEAGTVAFPFHKILTTSKDILINQAIQHPLRLQAFARIPSRIGNDIANLDAELGNQPMDNDIRGGVVTKPTFSKYYPAQKVYNDYQPFIAPFETLSRIINPKPNRNEETGVAGAFDVISGNLSPITGLMNALQGKDRYGNLAVAPNVMKVGGKYVALDNNGNHITQPEPNVLGTTANFITSNFFPAVTFANQTLLPAIGALTGREYFRPTSSAIFGQYEGQQPIPVLSEGRTDRLGIKTPDEFYGSQLGFKTRDVYFPYKPIATTRDLQQAVTKQGRRKLQYYNRRYR